MRREKYRQIRDSETSFLACVVDLASTRWMEMEMENNTMRDILEADSVVLMDWLDRGEK